MEDLIWETSEDEKPGEARTSDFLPARLRLRNAEEDDDLLEMQLHRIWVCSSVEELAQLMMCQFTSPSGRGSVGFNRFQPTGLQGGNTHTFEWRQMAGSLEPSQIHL